MVKKHLGSYKYAKEGFMQMLSLHHTNFLVEIFATGLVIILSIVTNITFVEWFFVIFCCGFVLTTEILNTSIEAACDAIDLNHNPQIKVAKDIAAAAVVMSGITSLILGLMIFVPRLIHF